MEGWASLIYETIPMRKLYKAALAGLTLSLLSQQIRHFFETPHPIPVTPEEPNNFLNESEIAHFREKEFSGASVKMHPPYETYLRDAGRKEEIRHFTAVP